MMKKNLLFFLLAINVPAFADMAPEFDLSRLAWNATHILVAKGTDHQKKFEIIESWKGELKTGAIISVPYLDDFEFSTNDKSAWNEENDLRIERNKQFNRVILFLRRNEQGQWQSAYFSSEEWKEYSGKAYGMTTNADKEYMKISMAWSEDTATFAFFQMMNPGPRMLSSCDKSEKEFKRYVLNIAARKNRFEQNRLISTLSVRADSLKPYLLDNLVYDMRSDIAPVLRSCGTEGARAMEEVLHTDSMLYMHTGILQLFSFNFGEEICPHLIRLLNDDRKYWESQAGKKKMTLAENNFGYGSAPPEFRRRADWNGRTYYITAYLSDRKCTEGRKALQAFYDFWFSHPEFDPTGKDQVSSTLKEFKAAKQ
ncbi:MAG: hypothetical protein FD123_1092 [Bacteroidetes bacterium]|nr:MAG: hypothetical protein FD123_1092 [Bacteroidota bacterium]